MAAPRQTLATTMILSAIDVLLCGFTAALTLFFIGAGADAASAARAAEVAAEQESRSRRGAGAPATIIVATYSASSLRLRPAAKSGFEAVPAVGAETAESVAWLLEESPNEKKPFRLLPYAGNGALYVTLSVSGDGAPRLFNMFCLVTPPRQLKITEKAVTTEGGDCKVTEKP